MTKAETKKIQLLDAAQFLEFQQFEDWFGIDDITTQRAAARWVQTREIMEMLNVEIDVTLADFQEAFSRQRKRLEQPKLETNTNNK